MVFSVGEKTNSSQFLSPLGSRFECRDVNNKFCGRKWRNEKIEHEKKATTKLADEIENKSVQCFFFSNSYSEFQLWIICHIHFESVKQKLKWIPAFLGKSIRYSVAITDVQVNNNNYRKRFKNDFSCSSFLLK